MKALFESCTQHLGEHLPSYVAATDDGHGLAPGRQLIGVKEEGGGRNGAAGLRDDVCGHHNGAHGGADFGFGDGEDAVDVALDVGEVAHADALGPEAVGDGAAGEFGGPLDDSPGSKARGCIPGELWLNAIDLDRGLELFDGGSNAAEKASAGDRRENQIDVGKLFDDFTDRYFPGLTQTGTVPLATAKAHAAMMVEHGEGEDESLLFVHYGQSAGPQAGDKAQDLAVDLRRATQGSDDGHGTIRFR